MELTSDGSPLFGKVAAVTPASRRSPLGSITVVFSVVEHATTKSLATVRTQEVISTAPLPAGKRRRSEPVDAVIPARTPFIAMTADPLLVRSPRPPRP